MKPILIVAPFEDMYLQSLDLNKKYNYIDVVQTSLNDAVKFISDNESEGIEVVISRGGTLQKIKESFNKLSTVEIKVSPYDILNAVNKAKKFGNNICVIGFKNIIDGVEDLGRIMDVNLMTYLVNSKEDVKIAFDDATSKYKIDVVLGGSLTERMAKEWGVNTVYLQTNKGSIEQSILEAKHLLDVKAFEREKTERFKAILNNTKEGIIATDKNGEIIIFNESAEKILNFEKEDVLNRNVSDVFKNSDIAKSFQNDSPEYGKLETNSNKYILVNKVPVIIKNQLSGMVATFEDITKIQEYEKTIRTNLLKKGHVAKFKFDDIIGNSTEILKVKEKAIRYSDNSSNILIVGDTGTGKEVFAQSIHNSSSRKNGPFIAINCAAIPATLIESELFGYTSGAFTGANREGKQGLFELSHTGTLFLDEIGETTPELQSRLLRVLQEREVRPIGSDKVIPIDVRIISATNKSLIEEVRNSNFRRDLYYRLNVLSLYLPCLKDRVEDIELFSRYFISKNSPNTQTIKLTNDAIKSLRDYDWPGNVRELENVIQRLSILFSGQTVSRQDVLDVLDEYVHPEIIEEPLKAIEKEFINKTILECDGNKTEAAKRLGISRTQLWRKTKK